MKNNCEEIIRNAIADYRKALKIGDAQKIARALNDMENVYIAVCLQGVSGAENLRQMILDAKRAPAQ